MPPLPVLVDNIGSVGVLQRLGRLENAIAGAGNLVDPAAKFGLWRFIVALPVGVLTAFKFPALLDEVGGGAALDSVAEPKREQFVQHTWHANPPMNQGAGVTPAPVDEPAPLAYPGRRGCIEELAVHDRGIEVFVLAKEPLVV
jgi:hypothetical protein